jgi:hypothetical protein
MENTPLDPEEPSTTEPTSAAPAPSSLQPPSETWKQRNPEVMFLLGVGLGLLSILFAAATTLPTHGSVPGCVLPALGLYIAVLLMTSKAHRFLAIGLVLGFLFAAPISFALWFNFICPPGTGC